MRVRTRRRSISAVAMPARVRAGMRSTPRQVERVAFAPGPARAVLPGRLAGEPSRRARLPGRLRARRVHGGRVPGARRRAATDRRREPCGEAGVHSLMQMGMTAYMGPLRNRRDSARLRQLLRLPAPGRRREDRAGAVGARGHRRSRLAALRTVVVRCADHGRWGCRMAAFARRPSTPMRRRSTCRSSSRTPCCSPAARRRMPWPRWWTSCRRCSGSVEAEVPVRLRGRDLMPVLAEAATPGRDPLARSGSTSRRSPTTEPGSQRSRHRALHLRRPPGRHGAHGGAGSAEPDPSHPHPDRQVRLLLRPGGTRGGRSTSSTTSSAIRWRSTTSWRSAPACRGTGPPRRSIVNWPAGWPT